MKNLINLWATCFAVSSLWVSCDKLNDIPGKGINLTVWEDSDFNHGDNKQKKHITNFIATSGAPECSIPDLSKIHCLTGHDSWNDRISSCVFRIGTLGSYPQERMPAEGQPSF